MKISYLDQYEKENNYQQEPYHLRTRQYSGAVAPPEDIKSPTDNPGSLYKRKVSPFSQHNTAKPPESPSKPIQFQRKRKEQIKRQRCSPFNGYDKQKNSWRESLQSENYQKYFQKPTYERKEKTRQVKYDEYEDSFELQNRTEASMSGQYKRENARTKGIEIKMNNIQSINDKIGNLLSMVKQGGSRTPNKNEKHRQQPKYLEYTPQEPPLRRGDKKISPQFKLSPYQNSNNKWDRSKRTKTLSGYDNEIQEPSYLSKHPRQRNRNQNQEDKIEQYERKTREIKFSPCPGKQKTNYGYIYTHQDPIPSPKCNIYSDTKYARSKTNAYLKEEKQGTSDYCASPKPFTYQNTNYFQGRYLYEESQRDQRGPPSGSYKHEARNQENSMIPMTMQGVNNHSKQKSIGSCLIDQKLKRIQQKIQESESGKNRVQRRLDEKMGQFEEAKAGKLYKRSEPNYEERFELKVYPVKIDRESVVKVASVLVEQVQIDSKIREAREEFLKEDSETKWEDLQEELRCKGVRITLSQLKELISISPEEFSLLQESSQTSSASLVDLMAEAQKHWQKRVCGCTYLRALKSENFNQSDIDINRNGYISQQNLTSFINRFTGRTLLMRDVSIIFRRLQLLEGMRQSEGVDFSTFVRVIAL